MKKYKIILLIVVLFSANLRAQNPTDDFANMKKYWFYHYRLVNDFMYKGDKAGETMIMGERANGAPDSHTARFGDQTLCLAEYISVLATEYKLLKNANQPTDTTVQELYYALRAFNRIDYTAETVTPNCNQPNSLNGFFIRDDVHSDFFDPAIYPEHQKFAHGVTSSRSVNNVVSDFTDANLHNKEMSQDQVMHLMQGLALVRSCLYPGGVSYKNKAGVSMPLNDVNGNTDIYDEAYQISDRIISYIKNSSWIVYVPGTNIRVSRGWDALYIAYGYAEAANYIKWGNSSNLNYIPVVHRYANPSYQDALSLASCVTPATVPVPLTWMEDGKYQAYQDDDYKRDVIATVGDSWYTHPLAITNITTKDILILIHNDWKHPWKFITHLVQTVVQSVQLPTPLTLPEVSWKVQNIPPYHFSHLPLIYQVLHGGNAYAYVPPSTYTGLLNSAPVCGPFNYTYPDNASVWDWSADSRAYDPDNRGAKSNGNGECNGLDYMLFHNLYHLTAGNTVPTVNYMDRIITLPFPTTDNPPFGTTTNPATIFAFNTITATNTINNNTNVTYKAGNEITLLPGFTTTPGANFYGYIQPFDPANCSEYMNTNNRSAIPNYTGQTTFVRYPTSTPMPEYTNTEATVNSNILQHTEVPAPVKVQSITAALPTVPGILVNPNPGNGIFQVMVTRNNQSVGVKELKVYDLMGKIVWSIGPADNAVFNVDISAYSPGIYYVRSVNASGEIEMTKLIKQ